MLRMSRLADLRGDQPIRAVCLAYEISEALRTGC